MGFFYVSNHGISEDLQHRLESVSRSFFSRPAEQKLCVRMEVGGRAWRGFFPVGAELTSGKPDQKEGIYFGTELDDTHPAVQAKRPLHGRNLFPPDEEGEQMREVVLEYMSQLSNLAQVILEAVALSLGLDEQFFRREVTNDPTILFRIFNYPKQSSDAHEQATKETWGVGEHTDYGLLTLLRQDDLGGLEVLSLKNGWIAAPPLSNTFVCNIGDMLERLTGGRFRSTPHRVRNPSIARDRLSWPLFFDPSWSYIVQPLPLKHLKPLTTSSDVKARRERWDRVNLDQLEPMTYGEYLLNKVAKVFPQLKQQVADETATDGKS